MKAGLQCFPCWTVLSSNFEEMLNDVFTEIKRPFRREVRSSMLTKTAFNFRYCLWGAPSLCGRESQSICPTSGAQFQKELKTNQTHEDDAIPLEFWRQLYESPNYFWLLTQTRGQVFVSAHLSENAISYMKYGSYY